MKKVKKVFTVCVLLLVCTLLTPLTANAISQNEVSAKLDSLMEQYVGTTWNGNYYGIQCKGFANLMFAEIFGVTHIGPYDESTKYYIPNPQGAYEVGRLDFSSMSQGNAQNLLSQGMPGDFIQVRRRGKSYGHSMILVNKDDSGITVFDCNSDGKNGVRSYYISWNAFYNSNSAMSLYRANDYEDDTDTDAPTINQVWMDPHDHTALMLKVTASDSSGISEVRSYHKRKGLSDWHMNYLLHQANDEWWVMLGPDDGYGDYDLHIYARDNAGNETLYGTGTGFGVTPPSIKNYDVIDLDEQGFTVTGEYSTGETSLESFRIPIWSTYNGQDDLRWETPDTATGNRFYKRINFSDHNNERGLYNIHMYATNKAVLGCSEGINGYSPIYDAKKTVEKDGHIYALYDNALSWESAKKKAEEFGGHLVTINNEEEQKLITDLIASSGNKKGYWLGGYKDNQWHWITDEEFSYKNWAPNQPDNAHNQEDKLMAFKNDDFEIGSWNDAWNEDYVGMGFVIEYENLNDKATKSVVYNGKKYIRYDSGLPWNEAQKFCESQGGNLAMPKDGETQNILKGLTQNGRKFYFLGLTNLQDDTWKWLDNSKMNNSNWDDQEPTNTGNIEHYVAMVGKTGKWRDVALYLNDMTEMGFVCEVPYEVEIEKITLNKNEVTLKIGETTTLEAAIIPEDAKDKNVTWKSSNEKVATINNGVVTAIATGQAQITVTSANGKQASCTVTVNEPEPTDQLRVIGNCDKAIRPGDTVTITVSLENYDISEEEIASLQIEVPNETNELSYIADSKKLLLEGSEFAANDSIIFSYLPFTEGVNAIPKDAKNLFSFQMKASDRITDDMDAQLPVTITMGNVDDQPIMQDVVQNITVPIRKTVIIKGDLNGSGGVDIMDARKAKRAAMKEVTLTNYELQAGDLNGDGKVDIIEARKIKRAAMKEIAL